MIGGFIQTWKRDIHGLFDYNSLDHKTQTLKITNSGQVVRDRNNVLIKQGRDGLNFQQNRLLSVCRGDQKQFFISFQKLQSLGEQLSHQEKPYLVVKCLKNSNDTPKGYRLKVGDSIKMGLLIMNVKEICESSGVVEWDRVRDRLSPYLDLDEQPIDSGQGECRICYEKQESVSDPLIIACQCKGSMSLIHLECLKQCIFMRITKQSSQRVDHYKWKTMVCELCTSVLPTRILMKGTLLNLMNFFKPEGPYIALQRTSIDSNSLYFIRIEDGQHINIGRVNQMDIQIKDETVSRDHAEIKYFGDGEYRIYDQQSKFGTIVEIKDHLKISIDPILCQVGRSLIKLYVLN